MFAPVNMIGVQPINDWFDPDTTQRHVLGMVVDGVDPYWGFGKFMYIKSNDAILKGSAVIVGTMPTFLGTLYPNTANLASPVGFAMTPMPVGEFGWIQIFGAAVYKTNATVAADVAIGIAAAGILGTYAAGKGFFGIHNVKAATATTAITNVQTTNASAVLLTTGFDGWFLGMPLSGTGIPASTVVAKLDPDGRTVYTGSAIGTVGDKNSTATGSVTVTGTYTGFGAGLITFPTGTNITV